MKKRLSWHFYLVCVIITIIYVGLFTQFNRKTEYACEMADLQTMRSAEAVVTLLWQNNFPEESVEYWFDSRTMKLIPASEPMPDSYGSGTKRCGYALKDFYNQTKTLYDYSESEDYTDKILHVVVSIKNNRLDFDMDWVTSR